MNAKLRLVKIRPLIANHSIVYRLLLIFVNIFNKLTNYTIL